MRFGALLTWAVVPLVALGCYGNGDGDDVTWSGTFTASEGVGASAGGAVIEVNQKVIVDGPAWVLTDPTSFEGDLPLPDLAALGDALARTDWEVRDAILAAEGTVALLHTGEGTVLLLLEDGPDLAAPVPGNTERLLFAGEAPLRVLVLTGDGLAALATRAVP